MLTILPAPHFETWPGFTCVTWLEPRVVPTPPRDNSICVIVKATRLFVNIYVPPRPLILPDEIGGPLSTLCQHVWEHCLAHDVNPASRYDLEILSFWLDHFSPGSPSS